MSEVTQGILRMPPDLWRDDPLDVAQRHSAYVEAADQVERLQARVERLETALKRIEEYSADCGWPTADMAKQALTETDDE